MSGGKKRVAATRDGYESDTSNEPGQPHDTRQRTRPHASALLQSEPNVDVMAMIRAVMEEQIRAENERAEARRVADLERETARRVEELERERTLRAEGELAAEAAAKRQFDQQEAPAAKQFEQQVALMRIQAELGEKAASSHRDEQSKDRKRDRALASIPNFREGEDVEEFLLTAERRLRAGGIREEEWSTVIASKLSGKTGGAWQDICVTVERYQEAKERLLKVCGCGDSPHKRRRRSPEGGGAHIEGGAPEEEEKKRTKTFMFKCVNYG